MKSLIIVLFIISSVLAAGENPRNEGEKIIKIGILDLEKYGRASEMAEQAQTDLISLVNDVGFYKCFNRSALENILSKVKKEMPLHCRDPKCVLEVGKTAGMDRMLYGSIEYGDERFGIRLTLIDVLERKTVETVNLQGAPGVKAYEIIKAAVMKLHGHESAESASMETYYGPKVHNERQFFISSAGVAGAALIYGAVNYFIEQKTHKLEAEYVSEPLSGITATSGVALFARPAALANAYVAASDDAYGVLYNPAGMAWISGPGAVIGYQYRFGLDILALSYVNKATREIGFGEALLYRADREGLMTEVCFISALAYKFNRTPSFVRPVSVGANVKILGNRIRSTSDVSPGGSSFGIGLDMGLLWELSERIRYGLLFRDVPLVNYWKNVATGRRYFEPNPSTLLMGGTFRAGYETFLIAEGQIPLYKDQPWKMGGGMEHEFFNFLILRVGLQREIMAPYETPWKITAGFGFKVNTTKFAGKNLSLDGSYEYNTLGVFDVINVSMLFDF